MYVGLRAFESWEQINQRWRTFLGLSEFKGQVHVYQGLGHALHEITHGLSMFLPHKKSLAVFPVGSPYPMALLPAFYRESYQVNQCKWSEFPGADSWSEKQNKDLLFTLAIHDHAFTGEKYPTEVLEEVLAEKRVPYIQVFHVHQGLPLKSPEAFGIHLYPIDAHRCLALIGSRLRFHPMVSPLLNWEFNSTLSWKGVSEDFEKISHFENSLPNGVSAYFSSGYGKNSRYFDRSVLKLDKISGDLFIREWAQISGIKLLPPGKSNPIETAHLCRWGGLVVGPWWSEAPLIGESEKDPSRTIILSLLAVNRSNNAEIFGQTLSACLSKQKLI